MSEQVRYRDHISDLPVNLSPYPLRDDFIGRLLSMADDVIATQ